jgi:serine phosphatase RsbU (regulator of sigma subunit)
MIGQNSDSLYTDQKMDLNKNDRIVLFTDGLLNIKKSNDNEFNFSLFESAVRSSSLLSTEEATEFILKELTGSDTQPGFYDDVTILIIDIHEI